MKHDREDQVERSKQERGKQDKLERNVTHWKGTAEARRGPQRPAEARRGPQGALHSHEHDEPRASVPDSHARTARCAYHAHHARAAAWPITVRLLAFEEGPRAFGFAGSLARWLAGRRGRRA
jgi:hypothetical protein